MSDSQFSSLSSSSYDGSASPSAAAPPANVVGNGSSGDANRSRQLITSQVSRHWRDVFWMGVFMLHLVLVGVALAVLGFNRFREKDRLKIDRFTNMFLENQPGLTEDFWPLYAVAGAVGTVLAWAWLLLLGSSANSMMKFSVHILTTYLAVVSVLSFWQKQFFWGVAFAVGAVLQFLYVISVIDSEYATRYPFFLKRQLGENCAVVRLYKARSSLFLLLHIKRKLQFLQRAIMLFANTKLPFTMLVLQRGVKMVWSLPEVMGVSCAFMLVMLSWLVLWSFGVAGVVALSIGDDGRWWLLVVFCVSLFWTGAVLCNIIHVIVSGMVFLVLINGSQQADSMPPKPVMRSLRYAVTTSFGSICYGSLFTAAIRTLRWKIRGIRSKIGKNECLLCCVDFLFHLVETLVRFFNKYAYVQIAVYGKNFNRSARDAWELFQSTGVEALIAYDCSGAVILMGTLVGGLVAGTCAGVWTRIKHPDRVMMVGSTSMLMGMILVGLATVVVESAVTSIYICYAEDPVLIQTWDAEFFNKMSEMLHQRLQHRSARATQVLTSRFDSQMRETAAV